MMVLPEQVKIVEVGPRDGLQNEASVLATADKIDFINQLSATGLSVIEVTSFVSPKWIPQLADATQVMQGISKKPSVLYPVLVPNVQGFERARLAGCNAIAVFTTSSEQFSLKNTHCSVEESVKRALEVMAFAKQQGCWVRAYISCVLGCPFEGEIDPQKVAMQAKYLVDSGADEISLGDTIGVGTPLKVQQLLAIVAKQVPIHQLAVHFHDTYGQALANILAALQMGVGVVDSAVSGLGGCPYAKGASGNVATEEVVYMLQGLGIETGVDLKKLIQVGNFISNRLGRVTQSKVAAAFCHKNAGF